MRLKLWPTAISDDSDSTIHEVAPQVIGEIRGRVRTPDGLPVSGATVEATGHRVGIVRAGTTVTDADGRYRLRLPPDSYDLKALKGDVTPARLAKPMPESWDYYPARFSSMAVPVVAGLSVRAADLELVPIRAARVTVTVRDEAGHGLRSAKVMFSLTPRAPTSVSKEAGEFATDENGRVQIGPLMPGTLAIHVQSVEASPRRVGSANVVVDGEPLDDLSVVLAPAASIHGRVAFDGRATPLRSPVGLRVVEAIDGQFYSVVTPDSRGAVDADGVFALDGLFDGTCLTVSGIADGWRLASIDVAGENYLNRGIPLASGQTLTGVVLHVVPASIDRGDRGGSCSASTPGAP